MLEKSENIELLKLMAIRDFRLYENLPMAVYLCSAEDGVFIEFNSQAANILSLKNSDKGTKSITNFYINTSQRSNITRQLKKLNPGSWLENQTVRFICSNKIKSIRFFSKPYFNDLGEWIGTLSLAFEITELERFRELEMTIPDGIFEIDIDKRISYSNPEFSKILGAEGIDISGRDAGDFFMLPSDLQELISELVIQKVPIKNKSVYLKRVDNGAPVIALLTLFPEISSTGKLFGSKGSIKDITFKNLLNEAPFGFYTIQRNSEGKDIIVQANDEFAKIIGFTCAEECIGSDISLFHSDMDRFKQFLDMLDKEDARGKPLKNQLINVVTISEEKREVIVSAKKIKYKGEYWGRIGIMYDVTGEIERKLADVRKDYSSFLHSYSAMLVSVKQSVQGIIGAHGTEILSESNNVNVPAAITHINGHIKSLNHAINRLLSFADLRHGLNPFTKEKILRILKAFEAKDSANVSFKEKAAWLRANAKKLRDVLFNSTEIKVLPKEQFKEVSLHITEILRFARLITLTQVLREVKDNLIESETFKRALITDDSIKSSENILILNLLHSIETSFDEIAKSRRIAIRRNYRIYEYSSVLGVYRDLYIALYNIVHNSLKYSVEGSETSNSWISISASEESGFLVIEVFNLGVPIRRHELESGQIFEFGFRGASSGDKERQGSGIGLWHAKKLILEAGGRIEINSRPVEYNKDDDYTKPFLTTVKIKLPLNDQK